jgi:hypothetical protein
MSAWIVTNGDAKTRECDSRSEAEDVKTDMAGLGIDVEIVPPTDDGTTTGPGTSCEECGNDIPGDAPEDATSCEHHGSWALVTDTGTTESAQTAADAIESDNATVDSDVVEKLPDKPPVDEDPLTWIPGEFTDTIDGSVAINRKGFEVMAHHYGIETRSKILERSADMVVVKATAIKDDGRKYQAHGSAAEARGDDRGLLVEMADTRARKRALSQATGVGMVAVSELMNE